MKPFMDEEFLLESESAKKLYHEYAENMPIYDYHCHLSPQEIAEDATFRNIGHLFLGGDHYKWRAMAAFGIPDKIIRGDAEDYEKFMAYAKAMPYMLGNPLYHWTHLELKRVFGITEPLNEKTAPAIWDKANAMLALPEFSAKGLIKKFNVRLICTTDDPADSLVWHELIALDKDFGVKVLPAFRPDKAVNIYAPDFARYVKRLSEAANRPINTVSDMISALEARVGYFHERGARLSDHGFESVPYADVDMKKAEAALSAALSGESVSPESGEHYRTALLTALGEMYARRGWVQQYHMNALRNNNTVMFEKRGPDTGFDSISDELIAVKLSRLLDAQEKRGALPKTILYSLNPATNYILASMAGNFQTASGVPGKVQFGSAWWFCDQRDGMEDQIKTLANVGLLSTFVGMLTDSRSFVSYPRHEYFRRILCNIVGKWLENGEYPADFDAVGGIIRGICYENAVKYFGMEL